MSSYINLIIILIVFLSLNKGYTQEMNSNNSRISDAYNLAVNTVKINVRRGILAAGGDYGGEWTRDIAINSWNGVSLLFPEVAKNSLWSVTIEKDTIGHQYWDKIIWVISAYNHYKITGDLDFLKQAYICSQNSLNQLEKQTFDNDYGLFTGPSVFNDGIAGYPEPIFDSTNNSSFVLDHKNSHQIKCLSTNCVYYGAYISLIEMGKILKRDHEQIKSLQEKADNLKKNILKYFYDQKAIKFYYLVDNLGNIDRSQEGLGISFAVIFGILSKEQAYGIIQNAAVSKFGITSIYPDFPRYSREKPGRHNNILWPMVNGFFARASITAENKEMFFKELNGLTQLALDEDKGNYQFWEIYNPYTGKPDGGWQSNHKWESCRLQTWSATAFINMVHYGLAGIRIENEGISFQPCLPPNINYLEIKNIMYRQSVLKIIVSGKGSKIKTILLNGKKQDSNKIDAMINGVNEIFIEIE